MMVCEGFERLAMRSPSAEWVERRRSYLGGTDVAAILEVHPFRTPRMVYLEKKGLVEPPVLNESMVHGQNLELYVMRLYRLETGRRLHRSRFFRHREFPFLGVNPDYEVRGERGLLECKTASQWAGEEFGDAPDAIPNRYRVQCLWQLALTGREWCDLGVLIGGAAVSGLPCGAG